MKSIGLYPCVRIDTASVPAAGQAGAVLLAETIRVTGLDRELSAALSPWRKLRFTPNRGGFLMPLLG